MTGANGHGPPRTGQRILSIDGGGIRGIIPLRILIEIERLTGRRVGELFDIVAGTSTGGTVALTACRPGPDGGPAASAEEILELYTRRGATFFPVVKPLRVRSRKHPTIERAAAHVQQRWGSIVHPRRYGNARYLPAGLEAVLRDSLGDTRLAEATADVIIPSYDMVKAAPIVFRSRAAREGTGPNPLMREVGMATTAAPTYLPPVHLVDGGSEYVCIDGGVVASNPATIAYYEALHRVHLEGRDLDAIVVSLGTGEPPHDELTYEAVWRRGWLQVARGMLGVIMDGTSDIADHLLGEIITHQPNSRYFRFQTELRGPSLALDDASKHNIDALLRLSDQLAADRRDDLVELAALLTATAGTGARMRAESRT